jgi:hypothetical protein
LENLNTYQRNYDHHCLSYRYSDLLIQDLWRDFQIPLKKPWLKFELALCSTC